ncbi:YeiH family protein [Pontibacter oryzae]|uniref:Putative sulfate exporter family transporter n=1 Tax=Pontibacter oryzae TaxID=2304593 RepID=A0A399RQU6_9BACT|nr:putative sulfate exporter family transporter [Pontibacter oryzae]RIJ34086.1 putative sulfate exporter family transporter [Pontibacter oryzae]
MRLNYNLPPALHQTLFILAAALIIFSPWFSSPEALALGLGFGLILGNPLQELSEKAAKYVLQAAVVGLGFGIDLYQVADTGLSGLLYTAISLSVTMLLGFLLGRFFNITPKLTHLVSVGTAICGGSAIAAVSPAIKANAQDISVSLGIVFTLNALALFVFPVVGHAFGLNQQQFGTWAAIAIHDTSSVVGAAAKYGDEALQLATTLKLTRALWIVPMVLVSGMAFKSGEAKAKVPVFILLFILASVLVTFVPAALAVAPPILLAAKKGLLLSLFLIGANLSRATLRSISAKPFYQGLILWLLVASASLAVILMF